MTPKKPKKLLDRRVDGGGGLAVRDRKAEGPQLQDQVPSKTLTSRSTAAHDVACPDRGKSHDPTSVGPGYETGTSD
jgi:hypothetical protein